MKYDLISDFHVEQNKLYKDSRFREEGDPYVYAWHKDRKSPILVVAGDTSNLVDSTSFIIEEAADYYEIVLFVDGNHDNYGCTKWVEFTKDEKGRSVGYFADISTIPQEMKKFEDFADSVDNVGYLNEHRTFLRDGVLFIGANGWYDFAVPTDMRMSDRVGAWRANTHDPECLNWGGNYRSDKPDGAIALAKKQAGALRDHVLEAQDNLDVREIVVTTHIPPIPSVLLSPEHPKLGHLAQSNGSYYNSHMQEVIDADRGKKIRTWNFGHTHFPFDVMEYGIRFICNPRGYNSERWRSAGDFKGVVQIDTEASESAFGKKE